ncbi:MAG: hypothetical protein PHC88_14585 [Terrimicrobiaceae bacterium]|nr:hypothetical protein [Terrimicrobiaceae bacterium]
MELTELTPAALTELIQLVDKKQALLLQIEKIDKSLQAAVAGKAPVKSSPKTAKTPKPARPVAAVKSAPKPAPIPAAPAPVRAKRGSMKEGILAALQAAGAEGLAVSSIAAKLGVAPANVHVWFSTTGKKVPQITKLGAGLYAYGEPAPAATPLPATVAIEQPVVLEIVEEIVSAVPFVPFVEPIEATPKNDAFHLVTVE